MSQENSVVTFLDVPSLKRFHIFLKLFPQGSHHEKTRQLFHFVTGEQCGDLP